MLSRLTTGLRAHEREERKRVAATQLHLTEEVERMRHLVMGGPTDDKTKAVLLTREEQLEAYRENERERLEVFAGMTTKLQGEVHSPYLSAKGRFYGGSGDAGRGGVKLKAPWSEAEVKAALAGLPKGKSPGQDGLLAELFVTHWDLLGGCFMNFARDFESTGRLPESMTTALTVLLHKNGEKDLLSNYRPITLLTTVYKVLAKVLANRLKLELHHKISKEQHGFLLGRSLADAVAVVADANEVADSNGEDWYLLFVDFQKAYDTVSRPFLFKTLEKLGLPPHIIRWTEGLHAGAGTRLAVNGWIGERVEMQRGVRQGCPLAPYFRADGGDAVSYVGYAYDTSLILNGEAQLHSAAAALDWFGELSGLRIKRDKSIVMPMGRNKGRT
ncbi:unnamed protein product [Closterium sp. NIES-65]|nr:unnamed protein product [Closterium sp. NIES-65]